MFDGVRSQRKLSTDALRVVDLFAGAGGTSEGAKLAGMRVVWAGNHWREAIKVHRRWHPDASHHCGDLQQFNWRRLPDHDILWASPACQGHSEAAQPARARDETLAAEHDDLRATMWAVIAAVLAKMPRAFIVENVKEVQEWTTPDVVVASDKPQREAERLAAQLNASEPQPGPTYHAIRRKRVSFDVVRRAEKGAIFRHWLRTFALAGYRVTVQVVNTAKFGTPQNRRRLLVVGHLDREVSIVEPKRATLETLDPILDFGAGEWSDVDDLEPHPVPGKVGARERVEHADRVFDGAPCWGWHASHRAAWARSPKTPANTITTQNQHYLVHNGQYRLWLVREALQAQGFRPDYLDGVPRTAAMVMVGNAVPPQLAEGALLQVGATF